MLVTLFGFKQHVGYLKAQAYISYEPSIMQNEAAPFEVPENDYVSSSWRKRRKTTVTNAAETTGSKNALS